MGRLRLDGEAASPTAHPQVFQLRAAALTPVPRTRLSKLGRMSADGVPQAEVAQELWSLLGDRPLAASNE